MKYNFDKIINRRETGSLKWDVSKNELPMWVADMDFETLPEIQEALVERVAHGVYGYSVIPDEWSQSYVDWWDKRHHFHMNPEKLIFTTGVIPALFLQCVSSQPPERMCWYRPRSIITFFMSSGIMEEILWKISCSMMERIIPLIGRN